MCICLYVYVHVYLYIIYICVCMSIYTYMCMCICVYGYPLVSAYQNYQFGCWGPHGSPIFCANLDILGSALRLQDMFKLIRRSVTFECIQAQLSTVSLYVHVINIHPVALKQQKKPSLPNVGGPLHVPFNKFKLCF